MHVIDKSHRPSVPLENTEDGYDSASESFQPLQIEEEEDVTINETTNAQVPFVEWRSTTFSLILAVLLLSLGLIGYLGHSFDKNSDAIGVEAEDKYIIDESLDESKFAVRKDDGVMYDIIGDHLAHDARHFTQGLTYSKSSDILFQSNGQKHKSSVCRLNATTGLTVNCVNMENKYFGEGLQVYGNPGDEKLIQITWKSKDGFIYDSESLDIIKKFTFSTARDEGWGICHDRDNQMFIVSDGSEYLHFWDEETLKETHRVSVTRMDGKKAEKINELEFFNGKVLANIWYEDVIVVIDPVTGQCESEYDMSLLWPKSERPYGTNVLNGISVSKDDGIFYVTGKLWNRMFRLKLLGFS